MFDTKLPQPNDSFEWVQVGARPALVCRALEPFAPHVMTTRTWALGVQRTGGERSAWAEVADAMGHPLLRVRQVHGADVLVRRVGEAQVTQLTTADIIVSNDPELALAIQTADCVPILIADRRTGAVAAAHAGWRGLAVGVPRRAVDALGRHFGSRPCDLVVAAGPSIGACCYEVGPDVCHRFEAEGWSQSANGNWFFAAPQPTTHNPSMEQLGVPKSGHWYFDSARAARDQLKSAGVPAAQIFVAGLCTASHPGALSSYRRDGVNAGRMAAAIRPMRLDS